MRSRGPWAWYRIVGPCLLLAPMALTAQAPAQDDQPTFRAGITYVEVDVTVTDRAGAFVRDLTRDDFSVFEDGVRQEVASFTVVDLPAPQPGWHWRAASSAELTDAVDADALVPETRVYALLLDMAGHVHNPSTECERQRDHVRRVRRLATEFLETSLGPDDVMSVHIADVGIVQELTRSRPLLRGAIHAFDIRPRPPGLPPGICPDNPLSPLSASFLPSRTGPRPRGIYSTFTQIAEGLAPATGRRKAIVWIGGSVGFHEVGPEYRETIRALARHNVVVHPVDPNGLSAGLDGRPITGESNRGFITARPRGSELMRLGALRGVAEDTGGIAVVNTNNFSGGFDRIVGHNSSYYLLGYRPAVEHRDGRFHGITVRVNRPGVSVRARRGYFASEPAPALLPPEPVVLSAAEVAAASLAAIDRRSPLHVRSSWVPAGEIGVGAILIAGEIDTLARRDPIWAGGATVEIQVHDGDGTSVQSHTLTLPAGEATFDVRLPDAGSLEPGEYTLRARVTAAGSSVPYVVTTTVRMQTTGWLGEAVLWRRGPSTGPRHVRTATAQVRRNEQLRMEWPTQIDVPASVRLVDRTGAPLRVPLAIAQRREDGMAWLVVDVPTPALAPGDYVVEVEQGGALQLTAFRVVP
jgi:VWFA-related protein